MLAFQKFMQDLVVIFRHRLDQLSVKRFGFLLEFSGNFFHFVLGAHGFIAPVNGLHVDQVDDSLKSCFLSNGDLNGYGTGVEALADGIDGVLKIGAHLVHLVDEANSRNAVFIGLAPYGFRLRFHAVHGVKHGAGSVEHAQRALHLGGKVHVAGRIDDIDANVAPETSCGGGGNRNAALLLLLHPVHGGGAFMHFIRSVVVVLPASMWAMMPMFLQRSNGTCLGTLCS